ncbi:MAG: hypothetical protein V4692_11060, partial [Bdellovibrionota bacterium]
MKGFFVVLASLFIGVFAHAADQSCPARGLSVDRSISLEVLAQPRTWSFCTRHDLSVVRSNLQTIRDVEKSGMFANVPARPEETWVRVFAAIDEASKAQGGLVGVSSLHFDIGTGRSSRITGVGSVFSVGERIKARYFILTASHVASGKSLRVYRPDGRSFSIRSVTHDIASDLSIIELDTATADVLPIPLATVKKIEGRLLFITDLYPSGGLVSSERYLRSFGSSETYRSTMIESLMAFIRTNGHSASVVLAPWLPALPSTVNQVLSSGNIVDRTGKGN